MTEKQLEKLMDWIDARIDYKIEQAFWRDYSHERIIGLKVEAELKSMIKEVP